MRSKDLAATLRSMNQTVYERPREKLRHYGVEVLTRAELLQLVLGSGGAGVSSAYLAREIVQLLDKNIADYASLTRIKGIGEAKACQVLACIELSLRLKKGLLNADAG